jgi:hypothetical protein
MPKSPPVATYLTRRRWTVVEARAALAAVDASGLRTSAFAAREGLDVQRLQSWRRKLGTKPKTRKARSPARASRSSFVELRPRGTEPIEIVLRSGRVLRVTESIDAAVLRRLVEVLDEPSLSPC